MIGVVLAIAVLVVPTVAQAEPSAPVPASAAALACPELPGSPVDRPRAGQASSSGQAAIDELGPERLAAVATRVGDGPDELRDRLLADPTLRVDSCGLLLYADPATDREASDVAGPTTQGPFPANQTFLLHSKPGANRVLYLDFNGETIAGTNAWAQGYNGGAAWTAPSFDLDGQPGTFSNAERDVIQDAWLRVAEDYRAFDIDVTTQDPGAAAIERTDLDDQSFGVRALIGNDQVISPQCGCGGIAYVDVFTRTFNGQFFPAEHYMPAWVFTDSGSSGREIAEITSHEVGHTFGLNHDGAPGLGYYAGQGSWAPIMGNGFRPISQWSAGEYAGATNTEDDLAIIATGAPVVADDVGGSTATATVLIPGPSPTASGIISTRTDKDVFRFTANGATTITVSPAPVGPSLDIRADLLTGAGSPIAFSDPPAATVTSSIASGLGASFSQTLAPGQYHLQVDGVGFGTAASTGYSDYASIGAYTVQITTQVAAAGVPSTPAAPTAVAGDGQVTLSWTAPADNGSPIDRYVVTPYRAGVAQTALTTTTAATTTTVTGLTNGVSHTFTVRAHNAVGDGLDSPPSNAVVPTLPPTRFNPLVPGRVLDSRPGGSNIGPFSTPWQPGPAGIRDVQIGGVVGVPVDAAAVVLNVTVVNPTAGSFLQLWPTGAAQPTYGSSLNFNPGQIVPNAVTVKLGTGGKVRVFNAVGSTDVIIDVAGYYSGAAGGAGFTALTPARLLDSRPGSSNVGAFTTPWQPGAAGIRDIQIGGLGGVPAGADAVVLNVTVVNPNAGSFLQLWPTGAAQPTFGSSLNFNPGQIVPNQVTVKLGTGGKVRVFNAVGNVDVIVDVSGYYDVGTGKDFYAIVPGRVLDSRAGASNIGPFSTPWNAGIAGIRDVVVGGLVGVPAGADGVVMNVTVVNPTAGSFLQLWPTGATQPTLGSSLNFNPGQIVPNAVTVKLGTAGRVQILNAVGKVDVIADVAGYFA